MFQISACACWAVCRRALGSPEHSEQADDEPERASIVQRVNVGAQPAPDERELRKGRSLHPVGQRMLSPADETEQRHEKQEQREDREKSVEGQHGAEEAAPVVPELLGDRHRKGQGTKAALGPIHSAHGALGRVHAPTGPNSSNVLTSISAAHTHLSTARLATFLATVGS